MTRHGAGRPGLVVLDFDGTMTDDRVYVDQDGRETVRCHRADGWGVRLLRQAGVPVVCVSSERNRVVAQRCRKLGIAVIGGALDKAAAIRRALARRRVPASRCVFLGNGLNDVPALRLVGWPVVVRDAHPAAKRAARTVLAARGGEGAVLELAERIIEGRTRRSV